MLSTLMFGSWARTAQHRASDASHRTSEGGRSAPAYDLATGTACKRADLFTRPCPTQASGQVAKAFEDPAGSVSYAVDACGELIPYPVGDRDPSTTEAHPREQADLDCQIRPGLWRCDPEALAQYPK